MNNGALECSFNGQYSASITVNRGYLKLADSDSEAKQYINRKLSHAMWIVRAINSRRLTIEKIALAIVSRQENFFNAVRAFWLP